VSGGGSLRRRIVIGTILWTIGLFVIASVLITHAMYRHPGAPVVFHAAFSQATPMAIVAIACLAVGLLFVRRGISPINLLRARLASVHAGREPRVGGVYPTEVQPLVDDLNTLLAHQEDTVRRAQAKAGDLAHGLKTPLAVLAQEADRLEAAGEHDVAGIMRAQIERMRRQIEYHLAHARAAASGAMPGANAAVRESVEGLARTLRRLHSARGLAFEVDVPAHVVVRVQREDLDEMLGNLLDNACKWARAHVVITASEEAGAVTIGVDDDGPGIPEGLRDVVLQRGVRADEAAPGSGLGLAIVRDIAAVYGGSISLAASPRGGLRARLRLPGNPA
jgi:signal transduction histidine kinase